MSKYVRTDDEIIYVGDLIKDEYGNYCDPKNYETDMEVPKEYIIKEADTIEELCDEFVVVFEDKNHIVYSQFKWAMDKAMWSGMPFIIYGAVWTDKGLIYGAKMNEKGDLELL